MNESNTSSSVSSSSRGRAAGRLPQTASTLPLVALLLPLERLLFAAGIGLLAFWCLAMARSRIDNAAASRQLDLMIAAQRSRVATAPAPALRLGAGDVVGRITAERVGVSTVVLEGDDSSTLLDAAGHIPGTALPGEDGNVAVAGHRDSFFRGLRNIHRGDRITFTCPQGTFRYEVEAIRIVDPDDTWVLEPQGQPSLTLVTCYPFGYIGHAPHRFVVVARQLTESDTVRPAA